MNDELLCNNTKWKIIDKIAINMNNQPQTENCCNLARCCLITLRTTDKWFFLIKISPEIFV